MLDSGLRLADSHSFHVVVVVDMEVPKGLVLRSVLILKESSNVPTVLCLALICCGVETVFGLVRRLGGLSLVYAVLDVGLDRLGAY